VSVMKNPLSYLGVKWRFTPLSPAPFHTAPLTSPSFPAFPAIFQHAKVRPFRPGPKSNILISAKMRYFSLVVNNIILVLFLASTRFARSAKKYTRIIVYNSA
jgi:hypothetical protein